MTPADTTTRPDSGASADRFDGLSEQAAGLVRQAGETMQRNDFARAAQFVAGAAALAPAHPEVLRLQGLLLGLAGRTGEALPLLQRANELRPDDAPTLNDLAVTVYATGDSEAAFGFWRRACALAPEDVTSWFNLGRNLKSSGRSAEAQEALARAIALAPGNAMIRQMYADVLIDRGKFDEAVAEFNQVLAAKPTDGRAWWGISRIAARKIDDDELRRLEKALRYPDLAEDDRMFADFAVGKAYEDRERFADAFAAFRTANAIARNRRPWNARAFSASMDATLAAFSNANAHAATSDLGAEIIFLVSLPRAGSTLTEQILAAHHDVEGAGELDDVAEVLKEESFRRSREFPHWVGEASAADWERLGRRYLERTARWRERHPRSTDKLPNNWFFLGAIRAMLPGARIVDCRRDPLETCWSCYKHFFGRGVEFSYDLDDLGAFWRDYDRAMKIWTSRARDSLRTQRYEALLENPEAEIRALLDFCGLEFDAACLRFHEASRDVRTASASQVRQPLRHDTARAVRYGELLAPLRAALAGDASQSR